MSVSAPPRSPWGEAPTPAGGDAPRRSRRGGVVRIVVGAVLALMGVIALVTPPSPGRDPAWLGGVLFLIAGAGVASWGWRRRRATDEARPAGATPYAAFLRHGRWLSGLGWVMVAVALVVASGAADWTMSFVVRGERVRADVVSAACREVRTGRWGGRSVLCDMRLEILYPDRPPAAVSMEVYERGIVWATRPTQIWMVYDTADPTHVSTRVKQADWSFVAFMGAVVAAVLMGGIWLAVRSPRRRRMVRRWTALASDPAAPTRRIEAIASRRHRWQGADWSGTSLAVRAVEEDRWYRMKLQDPVPTGVPMDLNLRGELRPRGLVVTFDGETPLWPCSPARPWARRAPTPAGSSSEAPAVVAEAPEPAADEPPKPPPTSARQKWLGIVGLLVIAVLIFLNNRGNATLVFEDFDGRSEEFPASTSDYASSVYEDGAFVITIVDPAAEASLPYARWTESPSDVRASAVVSFPADTPNGTYGGVTFLDYTAQNSYLFAVGKDGSYFLSAASSRGGDAAPLASGGPGLVAITDTPITVGLEISSVEGRTRIIGSVDGAQVVTRTLSAGEPSFNGLGLYAYGDEAGAQVRFDDVEAKEL